MDATKSKFKVLVEHEITTQQIEDTLITAVEGGSNYWALFPEYDYRLLPDVIKGRKHMEIIDHSDGGKAYKLNRATIERGLQLMAMFQGKHFEDMSREDGDATTGDVFLQLCLLGVVRYG